MIKGEEDQREGRITPVRSHQEECLDWGRNSLRRARKCPSILWRKNRGTGYPKGKKAANHEEGNTEKAVRKSSRRRAPGRGSGRTGPGGTLRMNCWMRDNEPMEGCWTDEKDEST